MAFDSKGSIRISPDNTAWLILLAARYFDGNFSETLNVVLDAARNADVLPVNPWLDISSERPPRASDPGE